MKKSVCWLAEFGSCLWIAKTVNLLNVLESA
jgi:hypothetical protein